MNTKIFKDYYNFLSREDKKINGVDQDFVNNNPDWEKERGNDGCWNCSRCSRCSRCSGCSGCSRLKNAAPVQSEDNPAFKVPEIENIHQKVLEAVSRPNALDMGTWHTCDTTHCRYGWVVHLAGKQGYELERKTSTLFAAQQIYHKSNPAIKVSPPRFYEGNEKAMNDMMRCAEEEMSLPVEDTKK